MSTPTIGGMTLDQWRTELATLTAARDKVLQSQAYKVGEGSRARSNQRVAFDQLQVALTEARRNIESLASQADGNRRGYSIVPGG